MPDATQAPAPAEPTQPEPVHTATPTTIEHHFENLLHHIIPAWGGNGRQEALKLFRRWHDELLAEINRVETDLHIGTHEAHEAHEAKPTVNTEE